MKLEVGECYLSTKGCILINNGYVEKYLSKSVIAHIPKELHRYIILKIQEYHTNKNSRKSIDKYKTRTLSNDRNNK